MNTDIFENKNAAVAPSILLITTSETRSEIAKVTPGKSLYLFPYNLSFVGLS